MSSFLSLLRRLEALGLQVRDLERTYASGLQLEAFAPTWTATVVMPCGRSAHMRGYYTMTEFARAPLSCWALVRYDQPLTEVEVFVERAAQPPPPWLAAWPEDPVP